MICIGDITHVRPAEDDGDQELLNHNYDDNNEDKGETDNESAEWTFFYFFSFNFLLTFIDANTSSSLLCCEICLFFWWLTEVYTK